MKAFSARTLERAGDKQLRRIGATKHDRLQAARHYGRALSIRRELHPPTDKRVVDVLEKLSFLPDPENGWKLSPLHLDALRRVQEQRLGIQHPCVFLISVALTKAMQESDYPAETIAQVYGGVKLFCFHALEGHAHSSDFLDMLRARAEQSPNVDLLHAIVRPVCAIEPDPLNTFLLRVVETSEKIVSYHAVHEDVNEEDFLKALHLRQTELNRETQLLQTLQALSDVCIGRKKLMEAWRWVMRLSVSSKRQHSRALRKSSRLSAIVDPICDFASVSYEIVRRVLDSEPRVLQQILDSYDDLAILIEDINHLLNVADEFRRRFISHEQNKDRIDTAHDGDDGHSDDSGESEDSNDRVSMTFINNAEATCAMCNALVERGVRKSERASAEDYLRRCEDLNVQIREMQHELAQLHSQSM